MLQLSLGWLVVALDVSVKAGLLALFTAGLLRLLKIADSNVRHRVWMGVLLGMIVLPVLSRVVPALQLPLPQVFDRLFIVEAEPVVEQQPFESPPAAELAQTTEDQEPTAPPPTGGFRAPSDTLQFMPGGPPPFAGAAPMDLPTVARAEQPTTAQEPA